MTASSVFTGVRGEASLDVSNVRGCHEGHEYRKVPRDKYIVLRLPRHAGLHTTDWEPGQCGAMHRPESC
jgi:hypothetical protein